MILHGDALMMLKTLPDESVQCCVTSPPYWGLRDYGVPGQLGLEKTPEEYVAKLVDVFREVRRVLRSDGVLWLNLGDSYATDLKGGPKSKPGDKSYTNKGTLGIDPIKQQHGLKPKDLVGIPWRVAFALQADGWWLRQDIIWAKPNPMPESVTDRCTKSHEYIFLLSKSARYYYDAKAVQEEAQTPFSSGGLSRGERSEDTHMISGENHSGPGFVTGTHRNRRSVWHLSTKPFSGAHFATFPPEIPEICIKAGSKEGDTILDPFAGSGTTLEVAERLGRKSIGIELNEKDIRKFIEPRLANIDPLFKQEPGCTRCNRNHRADGDCETS